MEETKSCGNCKFYVQHYYWCNNRFVSLISGHCTAYISRRLVYSKSVCTRWELDDSKQEQQYKQIEYTIIGAVKQLQEIVNFLKVDE